MSWTPRIITEAARLWLFRCPGPPPGELCFRFYKITQHTAQHSTQYPGQLLCPAGSSQASSSVVSLPRGKYPDDLELLPTTKDSQCQPLKFQLWLVPGWEQWGVNYMLAVHYSNITQKGKFGTIDSIKILSYRTNLTNITIQLDVPQCSSLLVAVFCFDPICKGLVWKV